MHDLIAVSLIDGLAVELDDVRVELRIFARRFARWIGHQHQQRDSDQGRDDGNDSGARPGWHQWNTLPKPPISSLAIQNAIAAQPKFQRPLPSMMQAAMTAKTNAKHSRIKPMFCMEASSHEPVDHSLDRGLQRSIGDRRAVRL